MQKWGGGKKDVEGGGMVKEKERGREREDVKRMGKNEREVVWAMWSLKFSP